jgi:hypothetical protein
VDKFSHLPQVVASFVSSKVTLVSFELSKFSLYPRIQELVGCFLVGAYGKAKDDPLLINTIYL